MNFLIDPNDVINYNRSDDELELWFLFAVVAAGKTSSTQARLLNNFLTSLKGRGPFDRIRKLHKSGKLMDALVESRLGQYNRLCRLFSQAINLNLRTCTLEDLEALPGCGPKTARMFLMMSRKNQRVAALDTHILKHLRANNIEAPLTTPTKKNYRRLENEFIKLAEASGLTIAEYDLKVWRHYSERPR